MRTDFRLGIRTTAEVLHMETETVRKIHIRMFWCTGVLHGPKIKDGKRELENI